ncbi:hypothetical protein K458DRAFT_402162 [Lentithecium fluviatile CBS 122367]|uniref:Uncharacterized protein n=1 Tax=Lentithecium fluviatile CBS 122367 TaxID=1168545 RepID=A0A6G1J8R7_9PLEO|nr:hypothetical protein K458DRAFT_402162 [Lentithecium fluviatile CBS 122367]
MDVPHYIPPRPSFASTTTTGRLDLDVWRLSARLGHEDDEGEGGESRSLMVNAGSIDELGGEDGVGEEGADSLLFEMGSRMERGSDMDTLRVEPDTKIESEVDSLHFEAGSKMSTERNLGMEMDAMGPPPLRNMPTHKQLSRFGDWRAGSGWMTERGRGGPHTCRTETETPAADFTHASAEYGDEYGGGRTGSGNGRESVLIHTPVHLHLLHLALSSPPYPLLLGPHPQPYPGPINIPTPHHRHLPLPRGLHTMPTSISTSTPTSTPTSTAAQGHPDSQEETEEILFLTGFWCDPHDASQGKCDKEAQTGYAFREKRVRVRVHRSTKERNPGKLAPGTGSGTGSGIGSEGKSKGEGKGEGKGRKKSKRKREKEEEQKKKKERGQEQERLRDEMRWEAAKYGESAYTSPSDAGVVGGTWGCIEEGRFEGRFATAVVTFVE